MSTAPPAVAGVPAPSTPPLTIVYVGNFRAPWCTEVHVAGSLEALGHRVHRLQEDLVDWAGLPDGVDHVGGQVLLWTRTWHVERTAGEAALAELRRRGVVSASFHLDRWFGLEREYQVHEEPFFRTDLVVSPDGAHDDDWAAAGITHLYLPPGVYHAECHPVTPRPQRYPHPVIFVGSHPYPHPEWAPYRAELIDTLERAFGRRFHVYPGTGRRQIRGRALAELYASASVVVGDSCLAGGVTHYWSDRIPETLGRGGLLIHPRVGGLADWYPSLRADGVDPDEIPPAMMTYTPGEFDQVVQLAEWALERPDVARQIAGEGRAIVLGRDTYAHRLNTVLAHLATTHEFRAAVAPTWGASSVLEPAPARTARRADRRRRPPGIPDDAVHAFTPARRSGYFVPRPIDLDAAGDFEVVEEVWTRNDYDLPDTVRGTVIDLGANVGAFTVLAALSGATRVIAVEPDPGNFERAVHHARLNGVLDRVTFLMSAVVGHGDTAAIVGEGSGTHLAVGRDGPSFVNRDAGGSVTELVVAPVEYPPDAVPVAVTTLEALVDDHGPIAFLKIDVEGAEFDIIEATPPEVFARVERIALEWHGPVMPHLAHLSPDRFGALVTKLADAGRVSTFGHPTRGGLLHWRRY